MTETTLEAVLRTVEPAVRLVSDRHLLTVVHALRDRGAALPANPDLPFWVTPEQMRTADVFPWATLADAPARLLLVTEPDDRQWGRLPTPELLREYWRLLFQAAILAAVDKQLADQTLTITTCVARLGQLGGAADRELRYVLRSDHYADPQADDAGYYRAFAAVYLDLSFFTPEAVEVVFPSLPPTATVVGVIGTDLDIPALLATSRPPGAADPEPPHAPDERWVTLGVEQPIVHSLRPPGDHSRGLRGAAVEAERKGNYVRAAILSTQVAVSQTGEHHQLAMAEARSSLGRLVEKLAMVLSWDDHTREEWRQALEPLLPPASRGIWPRAARCLYELQKIAADLSGEIYAVDLVEPIRTLGRRPVKRTLPHAPIVIRAMHLRAAHKQLFTSGLDERPRFRLERLFHHELHIAESQIRQTLTPILTAALMESGLRPGNRVEEVARDKLVAELLDQICERGYLRLGDLRDAIARNQIKLPDLTGPFELITGDPLLRSDTRLAYDLDGIYRRGEFYLRGLQRFSSIFFGTSLGRLLTLYLLGPLLASYMTLMAVEELRHLAEKGFTFVARRVAPAPLLPPSPQPPPSEIPPAEPRLVIDEETGFIVWIDRDVSELARTAVTSSAASSAAGQHHESILVAWPTIVGFAIFLLLVFHVPPFRRGLVALLQLAGTTLRLLFWELPGKIWRSRIVTAVRHSTVARFINRHLRAPVLLSVLVLLILFVLGVNPRLLLRSGWVIPAVLVLAYNTPWGWVIQDRVAEAVADWWRVIRANLIPGIITGIIDAFRAVANWIERRLYAVDEWLRFRGGDSRGSFTTKAALGLLWFPFAYVTRFAFYLLLEPQINPVKHFPVVTVSHKLLLPLVFSPNPQTEPSTVGEVLVNQLGLGVADANFWAFWLIASIPGVFGFIAWELLANWQLYRANRSDRLKPVTIGSHGETMRGLLRPGFHSGTVPKLFQKLRRSARRETHSATARLHHELDHVAEAVQRFAQRELIRLLDGSTPWAGQQLRVATVRFGCQRVQIEIAAIGRGFEVCVVSFENREGRILADLEPAPWFMRLPLHLRLTFLAAVRGLFDMGATELSEIEPRDLGIRPVEQSALGQRFTWAEWVAQWEPQPAQESPAAHPGNSG